jgi:hypothetical protein
LAYSIQKDTKKSRSELAAAVKQEPNNPFIRFVRAKLAATNQDFSAAEQDWKAVQKVPELATDSLRNLTILQLQKAEKNPKLAAKIAEPLQILRSFLGEEDWHFLLLTSWHQKVLSKKDDTISSCKQAWELARDDNQKLCEALELAFETNQPYQWPFLERRD